MLTEQFGLESNDSCLLEIEPEFYNLLSRRISKLPCRKKKLFAYQLIAAMQN